MKRLICILAMLLLLTGCTSEQGGQSSLEISLPEVEFAPYKVSDEKLGTALYLYREYETDVTFETVKTKLEKEKYQVVYFPPSDASLFFEGEEMYVCGKEGEGASIYVLQCDTEEKAKNAYRFSMDYPISLTEHQFSAEPFFFASAVVRFGKTVYWVTNQDSALLDVLSIYGVSSPNSVPKYKGGQYVYSRHVPYEETIQKATEAGYLIYGREEKMMTDIYSSFARLASPDGQGYLFMGQMIELEERLPDDDPIKKQVYEVVISVVGDCFNVDPSVKLVLLSGDTFVVGGSHAVDAFLAELEKE